MCAGRRTRMVTGSSTWTSSESWWAFNNLVWLLGHFLLRTCSQTPFKKDWEIQKNIFIGTITENIGTFPVLPFNQALKEADHNQPPSSQTTVQLLEVWRFHTFISSPPRHPCSCLGHCHQPLWHPQSFQLHRCRSACKWSLAWYHWPHFRCLRRPGLSRAVPVQGSREETVQANPWAMCKIRHIMYSIRMRKEVLTPSSRWKYLTQWKQELRIWWGEAGSKYHWRKRKVQWGVEYLGWPWGCGKCRMIFTD